MGSRFVKRRGLAFPITLTEDGSLEIAEDEDLTIDLVVSSISTIVGERPLQPKYGRSPMLFNSYLRDIEIRESIRQPIQFYCGDLIDELFVDFARNRETELHARIDFSVGARRVNLDYPLEF